MLKDDSFFSPVSQLISTSLCFQQVKDSIEHGTKQVVITSKCNVQLPPLPKNHISSGKHVPEM